MMPIPAKITKNSQPMMQKNAIMRMRMETGIERISVTLVAAFAAAISSSVRMSANAGLSSQVKTMLERIGDRTNYSIRRIQADEEGIACRHSIRLDFNICFPYYNTEYSCQCSDNHDHSNCPRTSRSATFSHGRLFNIHRFVEEYDERENDTEKNNDDNKQCVPDERKRNTIASCSICIAADGSSCISYIQREEADCRNGYGQR